MTIHIQALLKLAEGQACVNCGECETVVACHMPWHGISDHGTGTKCDDFWCAHLCAKCHAHADGPEGRKDLFWRTQVVARTLRRLFMAGHLVVVKKPK